MEWAVDLSKEAANYLLDSWPYLVDLRDAIRRLRNTENAIPPEGCHQLEPGLYWWIAAKHSIYYERQEGERSIVILVIKPIA